MYLSEYHTRVRLYFVKYDVYRFNRIWARTFRSPLATVTATKTLTPVVFRVLVASRCLRRTYDRNAASTVRNRNGKRARIGKRAIRAESSRDPIFFSRSLRSSFPYVPFERWFGVNRTVFCFDSGSLIWKTRRNTGDIITKIHRRAIRAADVRNAHTVCTIVGSWSIGVA